MLSDASATWCSPTRSSRSCHDSANPCRACARSPTTVRLRDGQRRSSICHSASVSSWASSTTTCANGPASASGSTAGRADSSTSLSRRSSPRSIDMMPSSESSVAMRSSTIVSMYARSAATVASARRRRRDASGSPRRCRAASRSGRSETVHAWASARWSVLISSSVSPGAHSRRYAGTVHRSPTRSVGSSSGHARLRVAFRSVSTRRARRSWSRSTSSPRPCPPGSPAARRAPGRAPRCAGCPAPPPRTPRPSPRR